ALRVLDHLRGFRDADAGCAIDARGDHGLVDGGDLVERLRAVARYHLGDAGQGVLAVARVDPRRRVAHVEAVLPLHARACLEHRDADLLRRAGIDRGLVDDDRAALHVAATGFAGADQRTEIGTMRLVDRGGDGDDQHVGLGERGRIVAQGKHRRVGELFRRRFPGDVHAPAQALDTPHRHVIADRRHDPSELQREGQPDVPQSDDSHLLHEDLPLKHVSPYRARVAAHRPASGSPRIVTRRLRRARDYSRQPANYFACVRGPKPTMTFMGSLPRGHGARRAVGRLAVSWCCTLAPFGAIAQIIQAPPMPAQSVGAVNQVAPTAGAPIAPRGPDASGSDIDRYQELTEIAGKPGAPASPEELAQAYQHYCTAARAGSTDALVRLGWMHLNGLGVRQDDAIAGALLRRASAYGSQLAGQLLLMVRGGDERMPECLGDRALAQVDVEPARPVAGQAARVANPLRFSTRPASVERQRLAATAIGIAAEVKLDPRLVMALIATASKLAPQPL